MDISQSSAMYVVNSISQPRSLNLNIYIFFNFDHAVISYTTGSYMQWSISQWYYCVIKNTMVSIAITLQFYSPRHTQVCQRILLALLSQEPFSLVQSINSDWQERLTSPILQLLQAPRHLGQFQTIVLKKINVYIKSIGRNVHYKYNRNRNVQVQINRKILEVQSSVCYTSFFCMKVCHHNAGPWLSGSAENLALKD